MVSLVTGATGLVGSHLVEALLSKGEAVRVVVHPRSPARSLRDVGVDVRLASLSDNPTLVAAMNGVDHVYHCDGMVSDWGVLEDFERANVHNVRNVLAAATRGEVTRFIYLSTSDVYGFPGQPVDETEHPSPRGFPYSDTKVEGETLVWNHCRRVGLPVCIVRPSMVYGPGDRVLTGAVIQALRGRNLPLIDQGEHVAGLTYVGNLVDALVLAAHQPISTGQAYNISDGSRVTWREFIHALADLVELPRPTRNYSHNVAFALASVWETYYRMRGRTERPPLTRVLVEWMGTDQEYPIDKAVRDLGYRPRVSFQEGMRQTAVWLRREGLLDWEDYSAELRPEA
jgi:nucleoside-diphosphate-sugar epimerase